MFINLSFFLPDSYALMHTNIWIAMVKIILVGIIIALVYSQPDLRLTVADWLKAASDFLIESVQVKPWINF